MSTLKSILTAIVATGLVAGAAFAASNTITVNLPEAISIGDATLASGQYIITESSLADGTSLFVFRNQKGNAAVATAMKSAGPSADQKTEVILSNEGGKMHLDKMFIAGESVGYQFN
jgi:hypothetical protein